LMCSQVPMEAPSVLSESATAQKPGPAMAVLGVGASGRW